MRFAFAFSLWLTGLFMLPVAILGETGPADKTAAEGPAIVAAPDVPPVIKDRVKIPYPFAALEAGEFGAVRYRALIDAEGRLKEVEILSSPGDSFSELVRVGLQYFSFEPAQVEGEPVTAWMEDSILFHWERLHGREPGLAQAIVEKVDYELVDVRGLDIPPTPRKTLTPKVPAKYARTTVPGEAVIRLVLGREGLPMIPQVHSASRPEFGLHALVAVYNYTFTPATVRGQPVLTTVFAPISF